MFRGTKLVEQNARLYLHWDDIIVEGYVLGAQAQDVADLPYHIPFSFTLFVTNHTYLSAIGDDMYPVRDGAKVTPLQDSLGGPLKSASFLDTLTSGSSTTAGVNQLKSLAIGTGTVLTANALKTQLHQSGSPMKMQKEVLDPIIKHLICSTYPETFDTDPFHYCFLLVWENSYMLFF